MPTANEVIKITEKVANWQMNYRITYSKNSAEGSKDYELSELQWSNTMLYWGMFQLSEVFHFLKYSNWLIETGERNNWKIEERKGKMDDYSVSQCY